MPFSFRQFLRQTPSRTLRIFLDCRDAHLNGVHWHADEALIARQIADALDRMPAEDAARIISDLERAHTLSDERGYLAMVNAAADPAAMLAAFEAAENNQERALKLLVEDPVTFQHAEDIRFFDYRVEGNYGRRFRCAPGAAVLRDPSSVRNFGEAAGEFYRRGDGSGRTHFIEVIDRNADGTIQINIFVEGLPSNSVEFGPDGFHRRPSRPAVEAAAVYCPESGTLEIVAKGGRPVHERLRDLAAEHLLDVEPRFDPIPPRPFRLAILASLPRLASLPSLPTDPVDGIDTARLRRLKLLPPNGGAGALVIEGPADHEGVSAPALSEIWFQKRDPLRRGFRVVQATISFHFRALDGRKPRVIHVELSRPSSSNLNDLKQADRILVEKYLRVWKLADPAS